MLVLALNFLLTHPTLFAKPMPTDFENPTNSQRILEDAYISAQIVVKAATEQKEAEGAFIINEFLNRMELTND
jgi:hypothetical protein